MLYTVKLHDIFRQTALYIPSVCMLYSVSLQYILRQPACFIFRQSSCYIPPVFMIQYIPSVCMIQYIPSVCMIYSVSQFGTSIIHSVFVVLIPSVSILHIHYFKSPLLAGMREPRIYRSWPRSRHASTCLQERNNFNKASKINYKKTLTEATSIKK